mmetsp:Transcript_12597/g.53003  ORF Transcript_12597/g.53003 Transcript_12597/m.53003 type:complete len:243 (-) Transcript_12597:1557-2285(-)
MNFLSCARSCSVSIASLMSMRHCIAHAFITRRATPGENKRAGTPPASPPFAERARPSTAASSVICATPGATSALCTDEVVSVAMRSRAIRGGHACGAVRPTTRCQQGASTNESTSASCPKPCARDWAITCATPAPLTTPIPSAVAAASRHARKPWKRSCRNISAGGRFPARNAASASSAAVASSWLLAASSGVRTVKRPVRMSSDTLANASPHTRTDSVVSSASVGPCEAVCRSDSSPHTSG